MVTTNSYVCILNYLFNIPSIMAETQQEPKELTPSYVIIEKAKKDELQTRVNEYLQKWYVLLWAPFMNWILYVQALVDPLVWERQQLTVREVSNIKKWALATTSTVTIPGTVNVSWCECNCW